jgi:hypothetical protein
MLLIVAPLGNALGGTIATVARSRGLTAESTSDFADVHWELRIDSVGTPATSLTFGDRLLPVDSIINLAPPWSDSDGEFCAQERMAAWWALLAAFPGPVVNRPTQHGLGLTLDRLRMRSPSDRRPFAWILRNAWQSHNRKHCLVRAADGSLPPRTLFPGQDVVAHGIALEITECRPTQVQRFAIGGTRVLPIAPYVDRRIDASAIRRELTQDLPAIAMVVAELSISGDWVLLDIQPTPSASILGSALSATIAGALDAVQ